MIRIIAPLIGLGFAFVLVLGLFGTLTSEAQPETAEHEFHEHPKKLDLASNGVFGKFDNQQLQRGFQVYKEVCAACHSLKYVAFRDLAALGYSEAEVAAIADDYQVPSVNPDTGEAATRDGVAADRFPLVYPNEVAARAANNNAIPPDLSLMTKARHDGAAYVYSLLTGYQPTVPAEVTQKYPEFQVSPGLNYNPYFPTLALAMAPPLVADNQVTYADGTPATVDQMAKDVAAFLVWTAEPKLAARHTAGLASVLFILIFTGLAWGSYKTIWRDKKH
ncbi:cytochrome c1 [Sphingomonas baiyangensis]|uniref:Cytochrome c1 n=1 Tax=Sphingomonas baiyangensis TaxID=2572576 RepID=A0A4U1L436_9SPHN|nr:cytochrome c1 [Sphingomonas baiyangensis]TKD51264.1 cytochrome c1 [Sphingomonas baiyangensis]